jgi:putative tricarboxylic transport membrane protein
MISWVLLLFLSAPLAAIAATFQSFDYFAFIAMGLALIAIAGSESMARGLVAGFLGMFIATVGFDPISATERFTFGSDALQNGFSVVPVFIGAFAVRQLLVDTAETDETVAAPAPTRINDVVRHLGAAFRYPVALVRSSLIGSWIGLLPGLGANIGAIISYTIAKAVSKNRDQFGKGAEEGVLASEAGANSTVGGALIPMIALGIPGSGQDVLLLAALEIHQITPGPLLMFNHPEVFFGVIAGYLVANIMMFALMVFSIRYLTLILGVPRAILVPAVLIFCVVGSIAENNQLQDAWVMLAFGVFSYLMTLARYPLAPFVIGFILEPLAEERLRSALMSSGGDWLPLLTRPVAVISLVVAVLLLLWPLIGWAWRSMVKPRSVAAG